MQNSKASQMFDSQPLGSVTCSNYIDYNLLLIVFKGTSLLTLTNLSPMLPHEVTLSPLHGDALNGCFLFVVA